MNPVGTLPPRETKTPPQQKAQAPTTTKKPAATKEAGFSQSGQAQSVSPTQKATSKKQTTSQKSRTKTPLAIVAGEEPRRQAPFFLACLSIVLVSLVTVLALNIAISSRQYQLASMRTEYNKLIKDNDVLQQQEQSLRAPQNLVTKAVNLGMVPVKSSGSINASTGEVSGDPKPAEKSNQPGPRIPAPAIPERGPAAGNGIQLPPSQQQVPTTELNGGTIPAPAQKTSR